jgi:diguanylate cyclase
MGVAAMRARTSDESDPSCQEPATADALTRPTDVRVTLWMAYLAAGALFLGVHASLATGSLAQSLLYDLIGASAVAIALVSVWRYRPDRPMPWILMAVGQALFVAGDLAWNWYEVIGENPFPSVADVLYLAGYPFIAAGLFLLIRRRIGDGDRGGLLDAAILTTAAAIVAWTFLIQPQLVGSDLDTVSLAISLAYPVGDLILIGMAMGLLTTPGARTASFRMLGMSLALLLVADQIYALQNLDDSYVSGGPIDSLYLVAYLLFGAAAAHSSMCRLTDPHPVTVTWLGPVRMACLAIAMVTGPLLVSLGQSADGGLVVVAAGTAILSLLVLARLAGLVGMLARDVAQRRALEAQLSYQAFHDPLTGLTNRRRFVEAAEAALAGRSGSGSVAVLFLDLDDFKTVNDSLGHAAGDALLVSVAERIRGDLRVTDVAARLGGDEFGILLTAIPNEAFAVSVAERLLSRLGDPFEVAGTTIEAGASIGIAIDSPSMRTVDDLLADADVAMYQAKALGKGRHQVFSATGAEDRATRPRGWVEQGPTLRRPTTGSLGIAHLEPGPG